MSGLIIGLYLIFGMIERNVNVTHAELTVDVLKLQKDEGEIIACLSTGKEKFLDDCLLSSSTEVVGDSVRLHFGRVAPGAYALAVFQDLNANGALDKNRLHLPIEPFGFSNNPRLLFGPPSYRRCSFEVSSSDTLITVKLKRI